jgi:hypothetical protein
VCAGPARSLFVLEGRLCSLGYHLQVLSPTTGLCSRLSARSCSSGWDRCHPLPLSTPLLKFYCSCRCLQRPPTVTLRILIDDGVVSAPLPPHLALGVRRRSAIALRLGSVCVLLGVALQVSSPTTSFASCTSAPLFFGVG